MAALASYANAAPPENLARRAKATATSEHNNSYLAQFACDGKIPAAGSSGADLGAAWCVMKARSGDKADFTLTWDKPVELSELIYWGRTTWFMNECWPTIATRCPSSELCVVGTGSDELTPKYRPDPRVTFVGAVPSMGDSSDQAVLVVAALTVSVDTGA